MPPTTAYYPRYYSAYAMDNDSTSEHQMNRDVLEHPMNPLTKYIHWMFARLNEFKTYYPNAFIGDTLLNQKKFDKWIENRTEVEQRHKKWAMR